MVAALPPTPRKYRHAIIATSTSEALVTASPVVEITATVDPLAACPLPTDGTSLYISRRNGYCFLYPVGIEISTDTAYPEQVGLFGRILDNGSQERPRASLYIYAYGPADGLDSAGYADKWKSMQVLMDEPPREERMVDGTNAIILKNLPSFFGEQSAFLVIHDFKYRISLMPDPEMVPDLAPDLAAMWESVLSSIHFFPAEGEFPLVRAADVCPVENADQRVMINELEGYCFAYPIDFTPIPDFIGRVEGGPILDNVEGFGDVRTSITVGTFGRFIDSTPRDVISSRLDLIDASSIMDTTLGGYPAVVYRNPQGPWAARNAVIVLADGSVYTIVAQPLEPERWPAGIEFFDRMWNTVTTTLQFFTPFR